MLKWEDEFCSEKNPGKSIGKGEEVKRRVILKKETRSFKKIKIIIVESLPPMWVGFGEIIP